MSQQQTQPIQPIQQYHPPTTQPYQTNIFIHNLNSYIGSQLLQTFRNDHEIQTNPNAICGTWNEESKVIGNVGGFTIIDLKQKNIVNSILKASDIIVWDLDKENLREFQYVVKYLRKSNHNNAKKQKLICISSLLSWNGRRGNLSLNPSLSNLQNRNSTQTFQLELQNLCLDINNLNIGVESYVVCSGLIYGYGECQLFPYFKKALGQQQSLKIYGTGQNTIPMIHLEDLCQIVRKIAFENENQSLKSDLKLPLCRYFFAVDSAKITQKQLIKCIAQTLGNGQVEEVPIENAFLKQNFNLMTLDLEVSQQAKIQNWHSKQGIINNITKIVSEFNLYRGLKPNRIYLFGAPAVGKTRIGQFLQKSYGLPLLTVKSVLDQLKEQNDEFAIEIKNQLEQIRVMKVEEQRKLYEEAKKKKKGKKDVVQEFDPSKIIPRLPQQQLIKVFKRRLNRPDCQNKGYILDGWPKTLNSCKALFSKENGQVQEDLIPNSSFFVSGTQEQVKDRIKNLSQDIKTTTHWNEEATTRRFLAYNKALEQGSPKSFLTNRIDIKDIPFNYEGTQQFIDFIERNGPLGFKKKEQKVIENEEIDPNNEQNGNQEAQNNEQEGQQQQNQSEVNHYDEQEVDNGEFDIEKLTQRQKQILNQKSRPIRQYLIDNVIPEITEGLLEICKDTPSDPIKFLIEFLEKKQDEKKQKKNG